jgi:hypothetical protein
MERFSFKRNPVLWVAAGLGVVLFVHNGLTTNDWTPDTLSGYLNAAFGIVAALVARANVYSPDTVDQFAVASDDYDPAFYDNNAPDTLDH